MKLQKRFIYAFNTIFKFVPCLLLLILGQIFYLFLHDKRIPIPKIFISHLVDTNNKNFKVSNVSYIFPNEISIGQLEYHKSFTCKFNDIKFMINDYPFIDTNILNYFNFSNLELNTRFLDQEFSFLDFSSIFVEDKLHISFSIITENALTKFIGTIKISVLNSIIESFKAKSFNNELFIKKIIMGFKELSSNFAYSSANLNLLCKFSLEDNFIFRAEQIMDTAPNSLLNGGSFFANFSLPNFQMNKLYCKFKKINFYYKNNQLIFENNYFSTDSRITSQNHLQYFANLQSNNLILKGKFSGEIPRLATHILFDVNETFFTFISDSNSTEMVNQFARNSNGKIQLTGINTLHPKFLNLKINSDKSSKDIFNGDSISVAFTHPLIDELNNKFSDIKIIANNFSVLESPIGNYMAEGIVLSDYSLFLKNISGQMGSSDVRGNFIQCLDPFNFSFNLEGYCNPTNINNWLGGWWSKIWNDFIFFDQSTPYGKLNISGIWGKTSHIEVNGSVVCDELIYRELPLQMVSLNIFSDYNSTYISSNNIEHKHGKIKGEINIPHKYQLSKDLNYSVSGDFPVNLGKKVLGKKAEIILNDLNLTNLIVNSTGSLWFDDKDKNSTFNPDSYIINLSTNETGTWQGINFDNFSGKITSENNEINLYFPTISIAGGKSSMNLNLNTLDNSLSFHLDIVQCEIEKLFQLFFNYQRFTNQKFSGYETLNKSTIGNGIVDLSLSAKGTQNNFRNFTGSGKVKIFDKNLSEFRLLGTISEGILKLPIPIPSGTLKFNKLEGPFILLNDQIKFDNLLLSGLFSKITNKGTFNLITGQMDILSRIQLVGNLAIPLISKIINITDPLSRFAEVKVTGTWSTPKWELVLNPKK